MAKLQLKTEQQIVGGAARRVMAQSGLNDLNPGSILLTLLEAMAQEDYAQYFQMLQIVRNYNIDTTTGTDLDNRAFEYGITRRSARAATGKVDILREAGFVKISTTFYTGFRARIAGDTTIFVNDASALPTTGTNTLVIGRGTPNEEEVDYSVAPVDNTNYYTITLDTPLTNDHALEESIILIQGSDTIVPAGTVVQVPATGRSEAVTFITTRQVTILAGEDRVNDVDVQCTEAGQKGNINVLAITGEGAFPAPPFTGARAENQSAFSNGEERETDTKLRNRIKAHIQGLSQSTKSGIASAIDGLVDPITAKRVVSSNIILPDNVGFPVKIYIDDGTGFEPSFENQGQEVILEAANGGETRLQLDLFPIVKAQLETGNFEPYDFSTNGLTLQLNVGPFSETLIFTTGQFQIPEAGTAEEVVAAINNMSNLIEARTSQTGKKIVISAKADKNEDIQVTGGTANTPDKLNFSTELRNTFYLYKNDQLLSKDGETAFIDSGLNGPYDFSGPDQNLLVVVDGKTANVQNVLIQEADFDSPAAAASATAAQVAAIINEQLAGATALDANGKVRIISNTELSADSKIKINSSTAATTLGFSLVEVIGKDQDYTLNPELGVIDLVEPLVAGDLITAGTRNTRAFLTASIPEEYSFSGGEDLDIVIDGGTPQTIVFATQSNATAQNIADQINLQLVGGTAVTRTVGNSTYLEIRTNTFDGGSIEILSGGTANLILGFQEDLEVTSITAHVAYVLSQGTEPYAFVEGQTLVIVLDNDPLGKTFVITMDYDAIVSSGTSTAQFASSLLSSVFVNNDELNDFYAVFKSGPNSTSGAVDEVSNPSGSTFRHFFTAPPANFEDFAIDDQVSFSGMTQAGNNGNFLITALTIQGAVYAPVLDKDLDNPSALTPVLGDRYLVAPTANTSTQAAVLDKDLSTPISLTPSVNDKYIVAAGANDVQLAPVLSVTLDSTLATPVHGNRYLINGTGLNDWAGHNFEIAQYNGVGTPGWLYTTPVDGDVVFDIGGNVTYQFDQGTGTWIANAWGGKAGKVANWTGSLWAFITPLEDEVRSVNDESLLYQYDLTTNAWTPNAWGGSGNKIAQWTGAAWSYTTASTNDVVDVIDESLTYQYNGTLWTAFRFWVEVTNGSGALEAGSSGSGLMGQRRLIQDYIAISGTIVLATPVRAIPGATNQFIVIPSTNQNVVDFFNNQKITSLSARADVELANQGTQIQISSKLNGSDGYVQVTGGKANEQLQFSTSQVVGLPAYTYYTGLIKLVHKTIYGDETDLVSYPGVGAAGVKFQILGPTTEEVPISLQVTLSEGVSLSSLENEIKSAVIGYINSLGVGQKVILSRIVDVVIEIEGLTDVKVLSPADNVAIAQNEVARTKASIIAIS